MPCSIFGIYHRFKQTDQTEQKGKKSFRVEKCACGAHRLRRFIKPNLTIVKHPQPIAR
jgi:hypothetical protein